MKGLDHTYNILKFEADLIIFRGFYYIYYIYIFIYIYIIYTYININSSITMIAEDLWFVPLECSWKALFFGIYG